MEGIMISTPINTAETEEMEVVQETEDTPHEEPKPSRVWDNERFRQYFLSTDPSDLLDPVHMPTSIDMGSRFIDHAQSLVRTNNTVYDLQQQEGKPVNTVYSGNEYRITEDRSLRVVAYKRNNSHITAQESWLPPPPQFLLPVLSYSEYKDGRARGIALASPELMFLVLRTNKTYLLTGEIEPKDSMKMKIPYTLKDAGKKIVDFIIACNAANLAVYRRETFPVNLKEWESSSMWRMV